MTFRLLSQRALYALCFGCSATLLSCAPEPRVPVSPSASPTRSTTRAAATVPIVLGLTLTVSNLEQSERFFQDLDFALAERTRLEGERWARLLDLPAPVMRVSELRLGDESVELREFESPSGRQVPSGAPSNELSFQHMAIVVSDMQAAVRRVRSLGVHEVSRGPQTLPLSNPTAGGIQAFYFRDSDWHALELIQFPAGKGAERWQTASGRLFLGIDHTAIVVSDTELSAPVYEELGFGVAGRSLNFGPEQALLSGVPGARVRITGFAARSGPGVEFLSYLEGRRGSRQGRSQLEAGAAMTASVSVVGRLGVLYACAVLQGLTVVSFPASSATLKALHQFSDAQYGVVFLPQVAATIAGSIAGGALAERLGLGSLLLGSVAASLLAEACLACTGCTGSGLAFGLVLVGSWDSALVWLPRHSTDSPG